MDGWHGREGQRHGGNVGGAMLTRHGDSERVLLGSRFSVLAARPSGIARWSSRLDDFGELEPSFGRKGSASKN